MGRMVVVLGMMLGWLSVVVVQAQSANNLFIVSRVNNKCVTVGSDGKTMQIFPCLNDFAAQRFDIHSAGSIKPVNTNNCLDATVSSNGNAVQVQFCNNLRNQNFRFTAEGRIMYDNSCLSVQTAAGNDGEMLFMRPCDGSASQNFATSVAVPQAAAAAQAPPPMLNTATTNTAAQAPPANLPTLGGGSAQAVTTHVGQKDNYLCVCLTSQDDNVCTEAVRSACIIGHIPQSDCKESFDNGNHDRVTDHVLRIIDNGAHCKGFDKSQVQKQKANPELYLPKNNIASAGTSLKVTSADHYLCVCIGKYGPNLDERCESAVKSACTVGHLPEGSCYASLQEGKQEEITDHILRLIDRGANCENQLKLEALHAEKVNDCPEPPCHDQKHVPTAKDNYLCSCLEDHESPECQKGIKLACSYGHIPKEDCDAMAKAGHKHGVTRHVLHLIDHGARCSNYNGMTFTNKKCHCKQKWTSKGGREMVFPDNCGDPGKEKGFDWCEIYEEEGCVGVDGSTKWDRCDQPSRPIKHVTGGMSNHYLCPCLDVNSSDEVCVAATQAACATGHLPSNLCAKSFGSQDHTAIADEILKIIKDGAKCNGATLPSGSVAAGGSGNLPKYCGKGHLGSDGNCVCDTGYRGVLCEECDNGYTGYPSCVSKNGSSMSFGKFLLYTAIAAALFYCGKTLYDRRAKYQRVPTKSFRSPDIETSFVNKRDNLEHSGLAI